MAMMVDTPLSTTVLVLVVTVVVWWLWVQKRQQDGKRGGSTAAPPPRVSGLPLIGSALDFGKDCRGFLRRNFESLQTPIFTARIATKDVHFVDSSFPNFSVERLFRNSSLSFTPVADDAVVWGFGMNATSVMKSNGPDGHSKDLNTIFHNQLLKKQGLEPLVDNVQVRLQQQLSWLPKEQETGLYSFVYEILFSATIGSVVSPWLATQENQQAFQAFDSKMPLFMAKVPTFFFPKAKRGRDALTEACLTYSDPSNLIQQRHATLRKFGVTNKRDVAQTDVIVMWAASANTIPSGFWCLYHILQDPDAYNAIVDEIQKLMQGRDSQDLQLSISELDTLVGLDSALQETFRLYSESMIARDCTEDTELDLKIASKDDSSSKYLLKKGSRVAVMMSLLHSDEAVFENACEFEWNRFLADDGTSPRIFCKNGKQLSQPVRPFGGGSSMCPGRKFAAYEIKAFLARLLYQYDLELMDPSAPKVGIEPGRVGLGINLPANDVEVRITGRSVETR